MRIFSSYSIPSYCAYALSDSNRCLMWFSVEKEISFLSCSALSDVNCFCFYFCLPLLECNSLSCLQTIYALLAHCLLPFFYYALCLFPLYFLFLLTDCVLVRLFLMKYSMVKKMLIFISVSFSLCVYDLHSFLIFSAFYTKGK